MRKKGFTLIELLAVIVILAVIALIATPMILGVIDSAKLGSLKTSTFHLVDAIELEMTKLQLSGNTLEDGIYNKTTLGNLEVKGTPADQFCVQLQKGQVKVGEFQFANQVFHYENSDVSLGTYPLECSISSFPYKTDQLLFSFQGSAPIQNGYVSDPSGVGVNGRLIAMSQADFSLGTAHFNGTNQGISFGFQNYSLGQAMTVLIRVRFKKLDQIQEFFGNWEGAGFGLTLLENNYLEGEAYINQAYRLVRSTTPITLDTWYSIAFVYDGGELSLYINGEKNNQLAISGTIAPSTAPMMLGFNPDPNTDSSYRPAQIAVQNTFVYQKALTAEEVKQHYKWDLELSGF